MNARILGAALVASLGLSVFASSDASATTRDEVIVRARSYANHHWSSTAANQTASCKAGYKSLFPADDYVGTPYGWGGYESLFQFDQDILNGLAAGAQETDGVLSCIAGVDCSGFVSMTWGVGHHTTSDIPDVTPAIAQASLLPGDVMNKAGYHVAEFVNLLAGGGPFFIEAAGYNTHLNGFGGWSYVSGYTPRQAPSSVTGTSISPQVGTTYAPIMIPSLPFTDSSRSTANSSSRVLDGCNASPATPEKGPEYVYQVTITTPGTLSVSVADDAATDVDVELLDNLNTTACKTRNDSAFAAQVGCGTYWVVVDTYGTDSTKAGPYNLNVSLAASGAACGAVAGPPAFNPKGKLGDACAYPGHDNLPFCNPNLGSDTCIYGTSSSFCSKACATTADCADLGAGGCCQDISGKGELYCMTQSFCSGTASSSGASGTSGGASGTSGGASGTSGGASSGGPGDGTSSGDPANPGGPVAVSDSGGGCSVTRVPSGTASFGVLAGLGLALASLARRRDRASR